jgi:hypothetical protein
MARINLKYLYLIMQIALLIMWVGNAILLITIAKI